MYIIKVNGLYYQDKNVSDSEFGDLKTAFIFNKRQKAIKKVNGGVNLNQK